MATSNNGKTEDEPRLRPFEFIDLTGKKRKLTKRQWDFCVAYLENRGIGYKAAATAGYKGDLNTLRVTASDNLIKPNIVEFLSAKLEEFGYNDAHVDHELLFVIKQNQNLRAKKGAIDTYYNVKGKFAPQRHEHTITSIELVKYGTKS